MSSAPYLLAVGWIAPAVALYALGHFARRSWSAPKGALPELLLGGACAFWPITVALGLALLGLIAAVVLLILSNSSQLRPR